MPALLTSVPEFTESPAGVSLAAFLIPLPEGSLDRILLAASDAVEGFCDRALSLPPVTTLSADVTSGALSLPVASCVNIRSGDVLNFPGGEQVEIEGADVSADVTPSAPYPGTISLLTGTAASYASGTTITISRQDRYRTPAPGGLTRPRDIVSPLREYPLRSITAVYQTLPWETETTIDMTLVSPRPAERGFVLQPGYANPEGAIWRTLYTAGLSSISYDIRQATHLYMAAAIASLMNPSGAHEVRSEGTLLRMSRPSQSQGTPLARSYHVEEAERLLAPYRRLWLIA